MKILSFGEIIWDMYPDKKTLGGAPLNFAAHSVLFGHTVYLASAVGQTDLGREALEKIRQSGIRTDYVSLSDRYPDGQCCVTLHGNGIPTYSILEHTAYDRISLPENLDSDFDLIAFGTLALREVSNRRTLERILEANPLAEGYTDLNIRPPFYSSESVDFCLSHATTVKISEEELPTVTELLFGAKLPEESAVASLSERYPSVKRFLITCGEKGAICRDIEHGQSYACPAAPAEVVSTVGAGDSFGAAFVSEYHRTRDIPASLKIAARVSAFVVSRKEAVPCDMKDFVQTLTE